VHISSYFFLQLAADIGNPPSASVGTKDQTLKPPFARRRRRSHLHCNAAGTWHPQFCIPHGLPGAVRHGRLRGDERWAMGRCFATRMAIRRCGHLS